MHYRGGCQKIFLQGENQRNFQKIFLQGEKQRIFRFRGGGQSNPLTPPLARPWGKQLRTYSRHRHVYIRFKAHGMRSTKKVFS